MKSAATTLHLTLGDHAARTLRDAIAGNDIPGEVHCIPDDLSHGPLDDGVERIAHMRRCYVGFDNWDHDVSDAFDPWRELVEKLSHTPSSLAIWTGPNVSEQTLLRMACWWLRAHATPLFLVEVPRGPSGCHVSTVPAGLLIRSFAHKLGISDGRRASLAARFEGLRSDTGLRRRFSSGEVTSVPIETFDQLVARECRREWSPAARVVANAMERAEADESLSDLFLASRLQALIAAGYIETDRTPTRLREYAVRLVAGA